MERQETPQPACPHSERRPPRTGALSGPLLGGVGVGRFMERTAGDPWSNRELRFTIPFKDGEWSRVESAFVADCHLSAAARMSSATCVLNNASLVATVNAANWKFGS